jgi:SAM-dependent methyltransferase
MIWPNELLFAQREVAKYASDHYRNSYRPQEAFYWSYIPKWMNEDWTNFGYPETTLDIGCCFGTLLLYVRRATVSKAFGVDLIDYHSPNLFHKWDMAFELVDIEKSDPSWKQTYDCIIFTEVLEHFQYQPIPTLRRIRDLLSPKGTLYLSTPEADSWGKSKHYERMDQIPSLGDPNKKEIPLDEHIWQYSMSDLMAVLFRSGLKIIKWDTAPGTGGRHYNMSLVRG